MAIAVIGLLLEVIGLPVILIHTLRKYSSSLENEYPSLSFFRLVFDSFRQFVDSMGSFYVIYSHHSYYWEEVVIVRRLLLALLTALVPYNNLVSNHRTISPFRI